MASIDDGEIYLWVEGADEGELRRGIAAARASFHASGVAPSDAFVALLERDMLFELEFPPSLGEDHNRKVQAFDDAIKAAVIATGAPVGTPADLGLYTELKDYGVELVGPHYEVADDDRQMALGIA